MMLAIRQRHKLGGSRMARCVTINTKYGHAYNGDYACKGDVWIGATVRMQTLKVETFNWADNKYGWQEKRDYKSLCRGPLRA